MDSLLHLNEVSLITQEGHQNIAMIISISKIAGSDLEWLWVYRSHTIKELNQFATNSINNAAWVSQKMLYNPLAKQIHILHSGAVNMQPIRASNQNSNY